MHTRSRKTEGAFAALIAVALAFTATAQENKSAASKGGAAKGKSAAGAADSKPASEETSRSDSATASALDYLFNRKPQDGSTAAKGSSVAEILQGQAIADDAVDGVGNQIDPEFESFLNAAEEIQELAVTYGDLLDETIGNLRERKAYDAIANLYVLGRYSWDARISEQLANRVMALRDAKLSQQELEKSNAELEEKIRKANWNADAIATKVRKEEEEYLRRENMRNKGKQQQQQQSNSKGGNSAFLPSAETAQQGVSSVMGRLQLTEEYFKSLDSRTRQRLNEKEIEMIESKARQDFQEFIGVLYEAQRHHHAWLASDFYQVLFGDGDLPPQMASQATASAEIINRIKNDVEVFKFKIGKDHLSSATKILSEAFSLSKHHPALRTVSREEKLKVAEYLADLQKVRNMIEARDFGNLDSALAQLEKNVADFDGTKPRALVNAVKRESDMRLGMAKLAAQGGDLEKAMEEFRSAAQAWPENPKLSEASDQFFSSQDVMKQGNEEFDKAYAAEDYRLIFDKQLGFAVAVRGDAEREEQLKKALEIVKGGELALEKAKLLERNRDPFGAWEALELAAEQWPEDPALNRRRADLAVRASEFVSSVSKARDAETDGDYGYSLTWFLNAQSRYPASQLANEGIKRVTDRVLGRPAPEDEPEELEETKNPDTNPAAEPPAEVETAEAKSEDTKDV